MSKTTFSPIQEKITKAFAHLDKYKGFNRVKENKEFLEHLRAKQNMITDVDYCRYFLQSIGSVRFRDKYGKFVHLEDIVAFDLKAERRTLPDSVRYNRKKPPAFEGSFPTRSHGLREHLYCVLKECYKEILSLYEASLCQVYTPAQCQLSTALREACEVNENDHSFKAKYDFARDMKICGIAHLGESNEENAFSLSNDEMLKRIGNALKAGNASITDIESKILSGFLAHHGGADLLTATMTNELSESITTADGKNLMVGTAKIKLDEDNAGSYYWENGVLVGDFTLNCYSFKDRDIFPPTYYCYDPETQQYVCFGDTDANESILMQLQSCHKDSFTEMHPIASARLKLALEVNEHGMVQPKVQYFESQLYALFLKQNPPQGEAFEYDHEQLSRDSLISRCDAVMLAEEKEYKALKDFDRDYTLNGKAYYDSDYGIGEDMKNQIHAVNVKEKHRHIKSIVKHHTLADFIVHHASQEGLPKTLIDIFIDRCHQSGIENILPVNVNTKKCDYRVNARGELVAKIELEFDQLMQMTGSSPRYYGLNPQTGKFVIFDDAHPQRNALLSASHDGFSSALESMMSSDSFESSSTCDAYEFSESSTSSEISNSFHSANSLCSFDSFESLDAIGLTEPKPCARTSAEVLIKPNPDSNGVTVHWHRVNIQIHHDELARDMRVNHMNRMSHTNLTKREDPMSMQELKLNLT